MRKYAILLVLLNTFFLSCKTEKEEKFKNNLLEINKNEKFEDYRAYVVIPSSGCSGCITNTETFLKENYKNLKIKFILTSLYSKKVLLAKTGVDLKKTTNIIIDKNNLFSNKDFSSIYPTIFLVDKGKLLSTHEVSPNEEGLAKLLEHLNTTR